MHQKIKILLSFGTRPEAIKMAPVYHALKRFPDIFETKVCVTAQHREMLDQVLNIFDITPDIDLNLMKPNQDLFDITASILLGMKQVLVENEPDIILVHGDTASTMTSAMAGFYLDIKVGHIEAGLRTHDIYSPFPEEFNRQVTSKITNYHFAPTESSKKNLMEENIHQDNIFVTGNTVIDSLFWVLDRIENDTERKKNIEDFLFEDLNFDFKKKKFILITGHRRENFGEGFIAICEAIREVSLKYNNIEFVYPVHLNPNVKKPVDNILSDTPNIHLINPLDYEPFIYLLKHCFFVITDSGGIQEEAPSLGKPVLVMRDVTERPEAVSAGTVRLVGANKENIIKGISSLIDDENAYKLMSMAHNPYGDGKSSDKIVEFLMGVK